MLAKFFAAEELIIGIFNPALAQDIVGKIENLLKDSEAGHQP